MRHIGLCLLGSMIVLLTGCAEYSNNRVKCAHINWYRLGYQDGKQGNYQQNLALAFPSCSSKVIVDKPQYQAGWKLGLKAYCTPRNAMRLGQAGEMYNNLCPDSQIASFDKAWRSGLRQFCTPDNGYMLGLNGKDFLSFCAPDLNPAFHRAYRRGAEHYQQLSNIMDKLSKTSAELNNIHQQRMEVQQHLNKMQSNYVKQSFSPQTQYQIQKMTIKEEHLATKEKSLTAKKEKYQNRYNSMKRTFLKMD